MVQVLLFLRKYHIGGKRSYTTTQLGRWKSRCFKADWFIVDVFCARILTCHTYIYTFRCALRIKWERDRENDSTPAAAYKPNQVKFKAIGGGTWDHMTTIIQLIEFTVNKLRICRKSTFSWLTCEGAKVFGKWSHCPYDSSRMWAITGTFYYYYYWQKTDRCCVLCTIHRGHFYIYIWWWVVTVP